MAAGYTSQYDLDQNSGTFVMTISDNGTWRFFQQTSAPVADPEWEGHFALDGDHISYTVDAPLEFRGKVDRLTWNVADEMLTYSVAGQMDPIDTLLWTAHPWERRP